MRTAAPLRPRSTGPDPVLEAILLDAGLMARRPRASGSVAGGQDSADFARRLAAALLSAQPVHRAFGSYLADRPDLLPPAACQALAELPGEVEPLPAAEIEGWLAAAGEGEPPFALLAHLDPVPLSTGVFRQTHAGRTRFGEEVEVVVARPAPAAELSGDRLRPLARCLDAAGLPGDEAVEGFRRFARLALDLEGEAQVLRALADDGAAFPRLAVPEVLWPPSAERGPAGEDPEAGLLVLRSLGGRPPGPETPPTSLARLAVVWLRQVEAGRPFPLDPAGVGVRLLGDGRVAWMGGPFGSLPAASGAVVREYLETALATDATSACERLLPELVPGPGAAGEDELLLRLRQVVPFRDGSLGEGVDPLADELCAAFRTARACGYRLRRPLLDLASSLSAVARAGRLHAPGVELVREAAADLRLERGARELWQQWSPASLAGLPAPWASLLLELPRKLDRTLEMLDRGEARVRLEVAPPPPREVRGGGLARWGAVLLVLLLVAPRLAEIDGLEVLAGSGGGTADGLGLLLLGLLTAALWWVRGGWG